ncbi:MAG: lamin tail domain-containing protein [Chitinivibrionia bacterium]|nr:lamin tail domain-containing protein [Chitinivibrionia bacterium]
MLKILLFLFSLIAAVNFISCTHWLNDESDVSTNDGEIFVAVSIENPSAPIRATTYSKLRLRILDNLNATVKDTTIAASTDIMLVGLGNLPAEKQYKVTAWTIDNDNVIIHTPDTQSITVQANNNNTAVLNLHPRVGSIVVQFAAVSTSMNIESFSMAFDSDSGRFEVNVPRAINTYVALNRVPYGASGKLSLKAIKTDKTLLIDWDTLFTFKRENIYLELSFSQNSGTLQTININSPYNTVFTAFADVNNVLSEEKNIGVVITEFCVNAADNADFVEIANLSNNLVSFKELSIEAISSSKQTIKATNVNISPNETFVFGNTTAPNYWDNIDIAGTLSLVSTSAIILIYGDKELLDYVIYYNYNNTNNGWTYTSSSSRRSWELKELTADPKQNNFGGAWRLSSEVGLVDEQGRLWYGSPGVLR